MWQYLWVVVKRYYDYFILIVLAVIFLIAYLFLYLRPSVLELSPLSVLSCGNSRLFGSLVERGTVSTIADVEIKCGGGDPVELKEKLVPAYLILNQPDEAINYFFIRQLVFYNQFTAAEELSTASVNQVHPRSTTVINRRLAPIGFPGFIVLLAGVLKFLTFIFSQNLFNVFAVLITPLIGALTPFFAYAVWRYFWNKQTSLVAAILLFILPAWWYNSSRPFQHNLLFLFLLLVALYFYLLTFGLSKKKMLAKVFFSGLFWGLALFVRPSEIVWLSVLGLWGLLKAKKVWPKKYFLTIAASLVLTGVLFFATQYAFYGHIFGSGYVRPQVGGGAGVVFAGPQGINFWQAIVLPFGLHPVIIAKTFVKYFFILFRPWLWLAVAGFCLLLLNRFKTKEIEGEISGYLSFKYLLVCAGLGLYILIYYGSWEFFDNLVRIPSIGTSYVRYFLPLYVFSLPLGAYFLVKLWSMPKVIAKILVVAVVVLLAGASLVEVYFKLDGLQQVKENVKQYQNWQEEIYELTEPDAIIVTRYADKYIFPGRKIIPNWTDPDQITAIINLTKGGWPVYLYDLKLDENLENDLRQKLLTGGVDLGETKARWDNLELRKIIIKQP